MCRDIPEMKYNYCWRVFMRLLCNLCPSLSELFVTFSLAKTSRKKVRESRLDESIWLKLKTYIIGKA